MESKEIIVERALAAARALFGGQATVVEVKPAKEPGIVKVKVKVTNAKTGSTEVTVREDSEN